MTMLRALSGSWARIKRRIVRFLRPHTVARSSAKYVQDVASVYFERGPKRSVAAARLAAQRDDWAGAANHLQRAIGQSDQTLPIWHFRFANALDHIGESEKAEQQRERALRHELNSQASFREMAAEADQDDLFAFATLAYELAAQHVNDPAESLDLIRRSATAAFKAGDHERAAKLYGSLCSENGTPKSSDWAGLVDSLRHLDRLDEAASFAAEARARHPKSWTIAAAAAWVATRGQRWDEAILLWPLTFALRGAKPAPRWLYSYGRSLEAQHHWTAAADIYRLAISQAEPVKAAWVNSALLEWRFRLGYCEHHGGTASEGRNAFSVRVDDVPGTAQERTSESAQILSSFAVDVTNLGLRVHGRIVDPSAEAVNVRVDGRVIQQVALNLANGVGQFAFTVRHSVLEDFPCRSEISVHAGESPLTTGRGGTFAVVRCPFGHDTLFDRLDSGWVITKKGTLVERELNETSAERLLDAYSTVRSFFKEQLDLDLFLMYGSLLGCQRDGRFIPGDDDLDVGFITPCTNPAQLKTEAQRVTEAAVAAGFHVTTRYGGGLLKIWIDSVDVDVYPIWFYRGHAWAYDAISASRGDFIPSQERNLLGTNVLVPRNPDALLESTYGPNWTTPQPGFRHYRSKMVANVISSCALTPAEAKNLVRRVQEMRSENASCGTFSLLNEGVN